VAAGRSTRTLGLLLRSINNLLLSIAVVTTPALPACAILVPTEYSAEAIDAGVVDGATGQPLSGVVVVAHWILVSGTAGGSFTVGNLQVLETLSGQDGRFRFSAWGPLPRKEGVLMDRSPELLLFKPGYRYVEVTNHMREGMYQERVRRSEWTGKTIEMRPFEGTPAAYANHLTFLSTSLDTIIADDCNWKRIPEMLLALRDQMADFKAVGVKAHFANADYVRTNPAKCGSPQEFFKSYRQ
jgi:hypothetical protein